MVEASRTVASAGAVWAIVIVATLATALLVSAPLVIGNGLQQRAVRRVHALRRAGIGEPAASWAAVGAGPGDVQPGAAVTGDNVPGREVPSGAVRQPGAPEPADAAETGGAGGARPDVPAQRPAAEAPGAPTAPGPAEARSGTAGRHRRPQAGQWDEEAAPADPLYGLAPPGRHALPAQRSGESDRSGRSLASSGGPEEDATTGE